MPDADRNHDRTSASREKSKAQQLARIRRNQQRCRERKRTHVAELERQVEALQTKIRKCEPCTSPNPYEHESALDTALRESAARRDLLLALGFDDEAQKRFIESAEKRQTVYTILQGGHDREGLSPSSGERLTANPLAPHARFDDQSARASVEPADLVHENGQVMDSLQSNARLTDVAVDRQADALDPTIDQWFLPTEALDTPSTTPLPLSDLAGDPSWLTGFYNSYANFAQRSVSGVDPTISLLPHENISNSFPGSSNTGLRGAAMASTERRSEDSQSVERCFLDTVVQFQPGESSTVCSIALALIFRLNRKGLSMTEMLEHLKPGIRAPSAASGECSIKNSVLFKVLAYISA